jgi:PilZ domain
MDRRAHHCVQLRLPARLRWTTPLGQKTEVCHTVNVSRSGALVPCQEAHTEGRSLWVTFPYDAAISAAQPEILAKVVRLLGPAAAAMRAKSNGNGVDREVGGRDRDNDATSVGKTNAGKTADSALHSSDGSLAAIVALRFEIVPRHRSNGNGNGYHREVERRASARQRLAVPIQVRPENVPWFEETMTIDCSAEGLKFRSNREYSPGEYLVISFESLDTSPWQVAAELALMVARVERVSESPALNVVVCRSRQFSFRF